MSDATQLLPEKSVPFQSGKRGVLKLIAQAAAAEFKRSPRADLDPSMKLPVAFNKAAAINPANIQRYIELTGDKPETNVIPLGYYFSQAFLGMATILAQRAYPLPMFDTLHRTNRLLVKRPVAIDASRIMQIGIFLSSFEQTDRNVTLNFESEFLINNKSIVFMETSVRFRNRPRAQSSEPRKDSELLAAWSKITDIHIPEWRGLQYAWHLNDWNKAHISTLLARTSGLDSKTLQGACSTGLALSHLKDHEAVREGCGILTSEYLAPVKIPGKHELFRHDNKSETEFALYDPRMKRVTVKGAVLV